MMNNEIETLEKEIKTTEFGRLCRSYRAKLGRPIKDFIKVLGLKQSTISKIEQGELSPSLEYIKKSMEAYGITDKSEKMKFLLANLNSSEKIEIPLKDLGPMRKEWLAALCIFGEVFTRDTRGWDELINWLNNFSLKANKERPPYFSGWMEDPF